MTETSPKIPIQISSADEYVALVGEDGKEHRNQAAFCEAPAEVWQSVLRSFPHLGHTVAQNRNLPVELLTLLSKDPDWKIRALITRNHRIVDLSEVLERLAEDDEFPVRRSLAGNPAVPIEIIQRLAEDPQAEVARYAQGNLQKRKERAERPPHPRDPRFVQPITSAEEFVSLVQVYDSSNLFRATHASASIEVWLDLIKRFPDERGSITLNKTLPEEVLDVLARVYDWRIRWYVVNKMGHPRTSRTFERLSRDRNSVIRSTTASRSDAPERIIRRLVRDPDPWVSKEAIQNLNELREEAGKKNKRSSANREPRHLRDLEQLYNRIDRTFLERLPKKSPRPRSILPFRLQKVESKTAQRLRRRNEYIPRGYGRPRRFERAIESYKTMSLERSRGLTEVGNGKYLSRYLPIARKAFHRNSVQLEKVNELLLRCGDKVAGRKLRRLRRFEPVVDRRLHLVQLGRPRVGRFRNLVRRRSGRLALE